MFIWLQFILFFALAILAISLPASRRLAAIITILLTLFGILQLSSYFLGGTLIDYKYIEHLNFSDIWSLKDHYWTELIIGVISFIIGSTILLYIGRRIHKKKISRKVIIPILLFGVIGLCIPKGMIANLYEIASLKSTKEKSFQSALKDLGISPSDYATSNEVTAAAGKNIIVISLESLERGFLESPFEQLTPNLQQLKKDHTYYPMIQNEGSGWTTGSMYTVITGLPSFFKTNGNETFQNTQSYKSATLTDVLKAANYDLTYLIGKKEFSGVNDMLTTFGFKVKSEKDFDSIYPQTNWGLHDMDLFTEAKRELKEKASGDRPFALFLSTISGHFPNGVYDERLEGTLPPQPTELEFMTAGVDQYIGELLNFLREENLLDNTALFIYPDHKLMGNTSPVIKQFENERDLFLITNTEAAAYTPSQNIYQLDLPQLIVEGAQIETNATFLTQYIKDSDKATFIEKNKKNLLALNEASLKTGNYKEGVALRLTDSLLTIENPQSNYTNTVVLDKENSFYRLRFDAKMRFIDGNEIGAENAFKSSKNTAIIVSRTQGLLQANLKIGEHIRVPKVSATSILFSEEELEMYTDWIAMNTTYEPVPNKIYLQSTSYNALQTRGTSQMYLGLIPHTMKRGINLMTRTAKGYEVNNFDTFTDVSAARNFINELETLIAEETFFAIVAHDSAEKELQPFTSKLTELGLSELAQLQFREAYIGYTETHGIVEERHAKSLSLTLPYQHITSKEKFALAKEKDRFIAHAGGRIDGINYTNSLEALNQSYANGFRHFELDIIETSDGTYVAAHDWNVWKRYTGYTGETPVDERTFLRYQIKEKYTPLNLRKINAWFEAHPDAILTTDKVNDPVDFSGKFVDKSRLKMELFTVKAIEAAQGLGITIRPSQRIIDYIKGDVLEQLRAWNVREVAVSRKKVPQAPELLLKLKNAGIKTYVYHVNFEKSKDEQYVFDYELDYIYGMYADRWHFGNQ